MIYHFSSSHIKDTIEHPQAEKGVNSATGTYPPSPESLTASICSGDPIYI